MCCCVCVCVCDAIGSFLDGLNALCVCGESFGGCESVVFSRIIYFLIGFCVFEYVDEVKYVGMLCDNYQANKIYLQFKIPILFSQ